MSADTQIIKYFGSGNFASRPATPSVPTGGAAAYFSTDTTPKKLSIWDGSAWNDFTFRAAPTFVQAKVAAIAGTASVTMSSAPTNGNLLIGFIFGNGLSVSQSNLSSGWTLLAAVYNGSGGDNTYAAFKWAGAGESTTQTPYGGSATGGVAVYEYSGAIGIDNYDANKGQAGTAIVATANTKAVNCAICGAFEGLSAALPTSITGATADGTASGSRGIAGFHTTAAAAGAATITGNYSGSSTVSYIAVSIL